ncbi:SDR family NAD(P)-dependent oxidoreductase [Sphingomonas jatrophae]|uniref:NAD(P)-dependent dehydrogenase, short-chain alcohol dehydrogenase family n=1 Tax=Sphingomonas jatrophae TaxID=1166337 RepID=A0A1I6KIH5_9SPHN|nr:SDR family NAD(P)-dependent oxidoreductase [Sphingomonas jatrophae]SFR91039.1 NAD(P)-dependent dehydrogenase, short-chain alcohol dehydrogenase family [Sphingomonas jatrophae]
MDGKIALVTGANKSIGFETVRGLAAAGMTVYLGSRDMAAGETAAAELAATGDVRPIHIDLLDEATLAAAVDRIAGEHGWLDILVNNAGIAPGGGGALASPRAETDIAMQTNVHGPAQLIRLAVPLLEKSASPRVVNVTSGAGTVGAMTDPESPLAQAPYLPYAYCLSKAAANAMTVLFANDLHGRGIRVNAVCPGLVKSALSHFMGTRGPAEGAVVVLRYATMGEACPTGGFFDEDGPKAW